MNQRRRIIAVSGATLALMHPLARAAESLVRTPEQMRGPFYPMELPLDRDNDLATVEGVPGIAHGEITHVVGRVLDEKGRPVKSARVEIWQVNGYGRYHHKWDRQNKPWDPHFQGWGQFTTGEDGAYRFRTVKPLPYPGRAPHIHFAIQSREFAPLTTQMYLAGAPENRSDQLLNSIRNREAREALIVDLKRASGDELIGRFDIVLGTEGVIPKT
ncbi:MAG TPA: protocatechuate 3,4-dioxygenase [Burkholderiales bacterium]|nr:protocatechuate 3,4-dioxygenase [Burkholderiales bacterium]